MAFIIENNLGRRQIRLTTNDIISIVREYQSITYNSVSYEQLRTKLDKVELYIPEDI